MWRCLRSQLFWSKLSFAAARRCPSLPNAMAANDWSQPAAPGAALDSFLQLAEEMSSSLAEDAHDRKASIADRERRSVLPRTPPDEPPPKPTIQRGLKAVSKHGKYMPPVTKIATMPAQPSTLMRQPPAGPPPGWVPAPPLPAHPPRKRPRREDTRVAKWHSPIGFQPRATS